MTAAEEKGASGNRWSYEQDKAFENAVATYPEDLDGRLEKIAAEVPGKTVDEVKRHYDALIEDVTRIDSGRVALPAYGSEDGDAEKGGHSGHFTSGGKASRADQERRKGIAWTEDEHRLFLLGLDKYGKGDWRSISRNFVVTRTPTQVASHAQKYFIRLNSMNKERRRSSIHDITSIANGDVAASQGPITGTPSTGGPHPNNKQQPLHPAIGQPIGGLLGSAVGTPVNLSGQRHLTYGAVPGAPVNMAHVAYPMPHLDARR